MDLAPEERVNMSLDELVKLKNAAKKATKRNNKKKPVSAGAAKGTPKKGKKGGAEKGTAAKVAQVVGTGKAKRAALQAQKRGLNASGKATKMEIDQAVQQAGKGAGKTKKQLLKKGGVALKGRNAPTGLKISFSTADLAKTTDKIVAAQVKGALSKQGNIGAAAASKQVPVQRPVQARSVSMPKGGNNAGKRNNNRK